MANGSKMCPKCKMVKPLTDFGTHLRSNRTPDKRYTNARCKPCHNGTPASRRNYSLRTRYKMSSAEFDSLFEKQGNRCASCGSDTTDGKYWHVDHDHKCCNGRNTCGSCVRGILCHGCNTALGNLGENPDRIRALLAYTESHNG